MPWRVRRLLILMGAGFATFALGAVVVARHHNLDTVLLGILGMLGGVAILITNVPNGGDHDNNSDRTGERRRPRDG